MSQKSSNSMNKIASRGNASNAKVGNIREGYHQDQMRGAPQQGQMRGAPQQGQMRGAPQQGHKEGMQHMDQREGMQHMDQREGMQHMDQREGMQHMSQAENDQPQCMFPAPAAKRIYCMAAPFTNSGGGQHFRLIDAYGSSRPAHM
jgi:hypothetical protein